MGQMASPVDASSSRKLAQPLVEQKYRSVATAALRRRMRRMAPARAEVEWVIDRESMGSCDSRAPLGRDRSGAVSIGSARLRSICACPERWWLLCLARHGSGECDALTCDAARAIT